MRIEHTLPADLLGHGPVRVLVVGAGGTGSAIVMGLPYLDQAMRVRGHTHGLDVAMMDGDAVSQTNCALRRISCFRLQLAGTITRIAVLPSVQQQQRVAPGATLRRAWQWQAYLRQPQWTVRPVD
jgi:hypothetical protein